MSFRDDYEQRRAAWSDIQGHMPFLLETAASYPNVAVLELGTRSGNSTAAFLAAAEQADGHVWSVDIAQASVPASWGGSPRWTMAVCDDLLWEPPLQGRWADVLFIDTSHEYAHTLAELRMYVPMVKPGGAVLLHDTQFLAPSIDLGSPVGEVARALDAFCAGTGLSWANRPGYYGLGVIGIAGAAPVIS